MATAESVKAKLQGLIDLANTTTGNTDADLTAAVNSLIAGFGQGGGGDDVLNAVIDRSITAIESTVTSVGAQSFRGCNSLTSAKFPEATLLDTYAFAQCKSLSHVYFPKVRTINTYVFQESALVEISLPSFTGTLNTVFLNSKSLKKVDLGNNNCVLTTNAFKGATSFDTLILRYTEGVVKLYNVAAFVDSPFASGGTGGTVYVPSALIETYKTETNWSTLYSAGTCNFVALEGSEYE